MLNWVHSTERMPNITYIVVLPWTNSEFWSPHNLLLLLLPGTSLRLNYDNIHWWLTYLIDYLVLEQMSKKYFQIPSKEGRDVIFYIKPQKVGRISITVYVITEGEKDAIKKTIIVEVRLFLITLRDLLIIKLILCKG